MASRQATGAARFTRRLTDKQRDAILRAVLIDGHSVAETIRMANDGRLGVPAFKLGTYAYDIVRDGRETFEASNEEALSRAIELEMRGAETDALANVRAIRKALKRDGTGDTDQLRRHVANLAGIRKARREAGALPKPGQKTKPEKALNPNAEPSQAVNTNEPASVIATLLETAPKAKP